MQNFIKTLIFIAIILFLEIGIFPHLKIFGFFPDLMLASVLSLSILKGFKKSLVWIVIVGLFLDVYSLNNYFGISIICMFFAAFTAFFLSQNVFKKTNIASVFPVFLLSITLYNLLFFIIYKILSTPSEFSLIKFIINIVYSAIAAVPVFYSFKKLFSAVKQ